MTQNKRFRSIDILKGIAMIMVIMVHFEQSFGLCRWFYYLQMGCPIFFVCSGFGIMCNVCKNIEAGGVTADRKSILHFYFSRFKALAPGWYLALLFVFVVNTVMISLTGSTLAFGTNRKPLAILINLLFLHGLVPSCNNTVMPGGWYIGTTAILYLLTPFILVLMGKFKSKRLFFVISSIIGMSIWAILYFVFNSAFSYNGFGYFFFLVHYPEYLLGIMLYYDLDKKYLNEKQTKLCAPIGLVVFAVAYILFYGDISFKSILSAWATALGTYLVLYYLISNEDKRTETKLGKVLASYGKNSYGIFLLHAFWTWPFIHFAEIVVNHFGFSIKNIPGFIIMIPIVLVCAYFTGRAFNKIIKKKPTPIYQR